MSGRVIDKSETNKGPSGSFWFLGILFLLLVGLGVRVWGSSWGLPHLYHPDEDKIVSHALAFGNGDLNPHYFGWPSLQMYVMFFIYGVYFVSGWLLDYFASPVRFLLAFAVDPSDFYLLGRWLSSILGALTIWLTYAAGRRLYGKDVGTLGAVFLAFNFLHVKHSHYITPDVPVTFMVMAAFWFAIRMTEEPSLKNYMGAGILTGLAISVKYPAFTIVVSLLTAHLVAVRLYPTTIGLFSRRAWLAAALIPIAFVIGTPYSLLDWSNFLVDLWHQKIYVSRPLPMFERAVIQLFENPALALGVGIYVFFLAGIARCLFRRGRADLLLLSFPLAYLSFMLATGGLQQRYLMPVLPFFCLIAALFLADTVRALSRRSILPRALARPFMAVATMALVLQPASQSIALDLSLSKPDTRTQAMEWIERNIPEGSRIALESYGPPLLPTSRQIKPSATVEKWREHRDKLSEGAVYGRLKAARLGQEWKKYNALIDRERDKALRGHPRYVTFKLRSIPYVWELRLKTGQVREDEVKGFPRYKSFFEPARFLAENNIEYVVLSSGTNTSKHLKVILQQKADLIHRVERQHPAGFGGKVPFYSFHNPLLEIYRLKMVKGS